ncbi:response regulator [Flavobacterium sp. AJR]|jgi:DNA-binding NtrC family response regulator|uniref:response regulator n=1 Tax=unclassified Flavobacterium TaxID=196869 RepID=UPI00057D041A|nr:response regulator [Flavobacterium sp. AJR]KIA97665.1 histidine kinase [Flavobacterium sp. JRM]OUL63541.1 response regulator [Flavobacterium sp. AJR]
METKTQFKFFIVDDDFFCANLYNQYLTNMDYNDVTLFANGIDCIDNLHLKPDIIFLDHNMEDITGFEVLKKIKRYNPNIYVVMVSGQENIKTAVDALKFGAFDYVIKGNDVNEKMIVIITKIIAVKEQLKKVYPGLIKRLLSIF